MDNMKEDFYNNIEEDIYNIVTSRRAITNEEITVMIVEYILDRDEEREVNEANQELYNSIAREFVTHYILGTDKIKGVPEQICGALVRDKFKISFRTILEDQVSNNSFYLHKEIVTCDDPVVAAMFAAKRIVAEERYSSIVNK